MASLREDIDTASAWIAQALQSSGYSADFRPQSLWSIDHFFDDNSHYGQPRRGGLLSANLGSRIFALGAYVGEVVRRSVGGTWWANDEHPKGEVNIELTLPDGTKIWPVQRVMKRYKNGPEERHRGLRRSARSQRRASPAAAGDELVLRTGKAPTLTGDPTGSSRC